MSKLNFKIPRLLYFIIGCFTLPLLTSCYFESDELILDETFGKQYKLYDIYEDEFGNKGVVASESSNDNDIANKHIIVISADEAILPWGKTDVSIFPQDTLKSIQLHNYHYGIGVLQKMINIEISDFPAQDWCNKKNNSIPYSGSWHLPSVFELRNLLYGKVPKLNTVLSRIGGDSIDENSLYWTCMEDYPGYDLTNTAESSDFYTYNPAQRAIPLTPSNKTYFDKTKWDKSLEYHVRAIKIIYYGK